MNAFRSRARQVALQVLYQEDLNPRQSTAEMEQFVRGRLKSKELEAFCLSLILGVKRNQDELDALLSRTAANWSLDRMAATDRNVLRMGAYEILYTDTPDRVAVNEAIELAKRFGGCHSAPFVNGILDKFIANDTSNKSEGHGFFQEI
ncbi:MAG: transcription antitermination factor NusB [Pirellulales bacterium]|nr:transcription antitermination factor NusB [Pirellulales bacterium]